MSDRVLRMIEDRFAAALARTQVHIARSAGEAFEILARQPIDASSSANTACPTPDGLGLVASIGAAASGRGDDFCVTTHQWSESIAAGARLKFAGRARDYLVAKAVSMRPSCIDSIMQAANKASVDQEQATSRSSATRAIAQRNGSDRSIALARHDGDVHAAGSLDPAAKRCR